MYILISCHVSHNMQHMSECYLKLEPSYLTPISSPVASFEYFLTCNTPSTFVILDTMVYCINSKVTTANYPVLFVCSHWVTDALPTSNTALPTLILSSARNNRTLPRLSELCKDEHNSRSTKLLLLEAVLLYSTSSCH